MPPSSSTISIQRQLLFSGREHFGLSTDKSQPVDVGKLTDQVEEEVFKELQKAGLFSHVIRFDPTPDFVITGRINALHERYRQRMWTTLLEIWTKLPLAETVGNLFDMKTHVSSGEADLTLFLLKPNGEVVGEYRARSSFKERFNPTSESKPGSRLDRALSEAVQQIQEQIVHDANLRKLAARSSSNVTVVPKSN